MPGLVLDDCSVGPAGVRVRLDVRRHRFLADHLVDGRALLSTVMGVEVMACATAAVSPGRQVRTVRRLTVGQPYLLPPGGRGDVLVTVTDHDGEHECEVTSADGTVHYRATLSTDLPSFVAPTVLSAVGRPVGAAEIYRLLFHGPSFQVLAEAEYDRDAVVGRLAADLPPVVDPQRPTLLAPLLVELCLQSAGLWDLAARGLMTVPTAIDAVRRWSPLDAGTGAALTAVVTPRSTGVFDAAVVGADGRPVLTVDGYRTTPFAHPYDTAAADRLRLLLVGART